MWKSIEKSNDRSIYDGHDILAVDDIGETPYITSWCKDVYSVQGGTGGPSGWFSGRYSDHWGDYPIMDEPKYYMEIPSTTAENIEE
jgi:hypothetical protein